MTFIRTVAIGCVAALFGLAAGCGESTNTPTADPLKPDGGMEASAKLQKMQPPPAPRTQGRRSRR